MPSFNIGAIIYLKFYLFSLANKTQYRCWCYCCCCCVGIAVYR